MLSLSARNPRLYVSRKPHIRNSLDFFTTLETVMTGVQYVSEIREVLRDSHGIYFLWFEFYTIYE